MIKDSLFMGPMLQLKLHQNFPQTLARRERAFCEHLVCDQFMQEPREKVVIHSFIRQIFLRTYYVPDTKVLWKEQ